MGKYKTKAIQTDLGIFRHNQTYPEIIQANSEPCVTLIYLKLWYTRTLTYSEPEAYSEPWHIHNAGIIKTLLYLER